MRLLRLTFFGTALLALSAFAQSETWQLDPPHSSAQFAVKHMGISTVRGAFTKVSGTVHYDPADKTNSKVEVSIDASSIDTRNDMRDKDLRGDHYFDVEKYPVITFKSKHVDASDPGKMKITGDLTMHGVTKEVTLDVDGPTSVVKDPRGRSHMGASATATVDRTAFGIGGASPMIGSDIAITIDIEMVKQ